MENVSKALMIAGGVLIALLVTTLLMGGVAKLRQYQKTQDTAKKNEQIAEFNSQFESYNKQVITGYELVSIGHMAEDTNRRYMESEGYCPVTVWVKPKNTSDSSKSTLGEFIDIATNKDGQYLDLIEFANFFDGLSDYVQTDYNKKRKLKEAYFKCDEIKYDDKVDKSKNLYASGRVIKMKFSEMTKRNT